MLYKLQLIGAAIIFIVMIAELVKWRFHIRQKREQENPIQAKRKIGFSPPTDLPH
jgi:hypothetical protein